MDIKVYLIGIIGYTVIAFFVSGAFRSMNKWKSDVVLFSTKGILNFWAAVWILSVPFLSLVVFFCTRTNFRRETL